METNTYLQFIHSGQLGTPVMGGATGAEGQILNVLDAALVTGCSPKTVGSVAIIDTDFLELTFGVSHGYEPLQFLLIGGAEDEALNGKHRILSKTDTKVVIAKGSVTSTLGTLTTKIAPLGWESMFGSTDPLKRAYRSKDLTSTRSVLYLDCELKGTGYGTNPLKKALFNVCEDMLELGVQINSFTKNYNDGSQTGKLHWFQSFNVAKQNTVSTKTTNWWVIGTEKFFYFLVAYNQGANAPDQFGIYLFGDLEKVSVLDQFNCVFSATEIDLSLTTSTTSSGHLNLGSYLNSTNLRGCYFISGIKGLMGLEKFDLVSMGEPSLPSGKNILNDLNPLTFNYCYSDVLVVRKNSKVDVGVLPFLKNILNNIQSSSTVPSFLLVGEFLILSIAGDSSNGQSGFVSLDLTPKNLGGEM